jgi:hypothetical protein
MNRNLIAFLLFVTIAVPIVRANVYDYHPASSLHLGAGFDPAHPTEPYARRCLSYQSERNIDSAGGTETAKYTLQVINSREQLYKAMHMSASIDASYGFFSASGSTDVQNKFSSSQDSLTWIAQAEIKFGRFQPIDPKPIHDIEVLSVDDIRTVCGTELVTQDTRGVVATIVYTFRNLSVEQKRSLSTAISASAKFVSGGGTANATYKEAVEEASQSSELEIAIEVRGGPGKKALEDIITADSDLPQIRAALRNYVHDSNENNAKAFQYETSSTAQYYPKVGQPALSSGRDAALAQLYSSYKDLSEVLDRIQFLTKIPVRPEDQYLNTFVSDSDRTTLLSLAKEYSIAMVAIRTQAKDCLTDDSKCHSFDSSGLQRVMWPIFPPTIDAVVAARCPSGFVVAIGHKPVKGERVGLVSYTVMLLGDRQIFDQATVVEGDNVTPVSVLPFAAHANSPQAKLQLFNSGCDAISHVDESKAFGVFVAVFDLKYQVPLHVTFEVRDKFGRITYVHPPVGH